MIATKVRRSRKSRWCEQEFAHRRRINPGDLYGMVSVGPRHDILGTGKWYQFPVCLACAIEHHPELLIDYYARDRKGIALVQAIHQRKALSEQETQDPQPQPGSTQA